jgi:hypothetical protein
MKPAFLHTAGVVLLPLALGGCMATTPNIDAHLGEATTDMRNAQIMNPGASRNMAVPSGLDGAAAKAGYDRYQKSFKAPEKTTNSFTIGVSQ